MTALDIPNIGATIRDPETKLDMSYLTSKYGSSTYRDFEGMASAKDLKALLEACKVKKNNDSDETHYIWDGGYWAIFEGYDKPPFTDEDKAEYRDAFRTMFIHFMFEKAGFVEDICTVSEETKWDIGWMIHEILTTRWWLKVTDEQIKDIEESTDEEE